MAGLAGSDRWPSIVSGAKLWWPGGRCLLFGPSIGQMVALAPEPLAPAVARSIGGRSRLLLPIWAGQTAAALSAESPWLSCGPLASPGSSTSHPLNDS